MMLFTWQRRFRKRRHTSPSLEDRAGIEGAFKKFTLADVPPGCQARVAGFLPGLSAERRSHLLSYGLVPGYWLRLVQHSPVTIVQVEHLELALERDLACKVQVIEISSNPPPSKRA